MAKAARDALSCPSSNEIVLIPGLKDTAAPIEYECVAREIAPDDYGNCIETRAFDHVSGGKIEVLRFAAP